STRSGRDCCGRAGSIEERNVETSSTATGSEAVNRWSYMPVLALAWIAGAAQVAVAQEASLVEVRVVPSAQGTTIDLGLTGPVGYTDFTLENPSRLVIDLSNARQGLPRASYPVGRGGVTAVRSSQFAPG